MNKYVANSCNRKSESGSVLAYTVLSALFLFFAVGLAADLSHLYLAKTELQNTADAAALAGASALTLPFNNPDRIPTAVDRALLVMNMNKYNFNNKTYNAATRRDLVEFAVNLNDEPYMSEEAAKDSPDNIRFIRVKTPSVAINTIFAIAILGPQRMLDAIATAGLSVPGNAQYCPLPLAAVECGTNTTCSLERPGVCNAGGPMPNPDGSECDPSKRLCRNCNYVIRAQPGPGIAPGNFQALCCGTVNGVNTCNNDWLRLALAGTQNCLDCPPVNPGEDLPVNMEDTNPGQKQAAIRDGLNTRLDCYGPDPNCEGEAGGGINPEDHPPDPNVFGKTLGDSLTWAQYTAGEPHQAPSHTPEPDRRKLIIPITFFDAWAEVEGSGTVEVSHFGAFFLKQRVPPGSGPRAGDVWAEYIGPEVVSVVGVDPSLSNNTNVITWVLYK